MDPTCANNLQNIGLGQGSPGYKIINGPANITIIDHSNTRMSMLMSNFPDYGRGQGNWTWQSVLAGANGPNPFNTPCSTRHKPSKRDVYGDQLRRIPSGLL